MKKSIPDQPNPLLDPFAPAFSAWAIVSAASTGIFDAIGEKTLSPVTIADDLGLDPDGVERLMPVLAHLGYAERDNGQFRLSEISRRFLTTESHHRRLSNWVRFCRIQLCAMSQLPSKLETGQGVGLFELMKTPEELRIHQLAMAETAMFVAEWVATHLPVPRGAEMMLDIGGSHGLYAAEICRRNAPMRAEVLELPSVVDAARSAAIELGTTDVVTHIEGDIRTTDLPREYSVAFLGNLVHHLELEQLQSVSEKLWNRMTPGGTIAIWDFADGSGPGDLASDLFSLFFYLVSNGKCHSESHIKEALQRAGFSQFRAIQPDRPSLHTLYVATRPAP